MKKNTRVGNIWTTTANATRNASRANAQANKRNTTGGTKSWMSTPISPSTEQDSAKLKMTLEDLEEELDKETKNASVVDKEEKKKDENAKSWADIVREHQVQSKAFSETVSMQGLAPIFDPKSSLKRKLTWFTIVFMAIIFTAFNIYTQILMYVSKPISVRVDFHKAKDLQFPTVTLCSNNFASYASAASFQGVEATVAVKPLLFSMETVEPDFSSFDFSYYHIVGWETFFEMLAQSMTQMMLRV